MRLVKLFVAGVALVALSLAATPMPQSSTAFAAEFLPIKPRVDKRCRISCLTGYNGNRYCGIGAGQKGCAKIINNNCIFVLCQVF